MQGYANTGGNPALNPVEQENLSLLVDDSQLNLEVIQAIADSQNSDVNLASNLHLGAVTSGD